MSAHKRTPYATILLLVISLMSIAVAVSADGNWVKSPDEIHSGNATQISFNICYSVHHTGNITQTFSTGFEGAEWEYSLDVNGVEKERYRLSGSPATSPSPGTSVRDGDSVHMLVSLNATAPFVSEKTAIRAAKADGNFNNGSNANSIYFDIYVNP